MAVFIGFYLVSCNLHKKSEYTMDAYPKGTFGYDLNYLSAKDSLVVLSGNDGCSRVIVSPKYQAKVFTSTVAGLKGMSLGYLNYKALDAPGINEHMNGYGGENRLWLGPEGGRFSIFFRPGTQQVYDNWCTPAPIDTEPWRVIVSGRTSVTLEKEIQVTNYLGTELRACITRSIALLEPVEIEKRLGVPVMREVKTVAYTTDNQLRNRNDFEWTPETGTLCIWILDMFATAPRALTIVPYNEGDDCRLGKVATTDYFGEIPADRLKIEGGILYLRTDGNYRSKLGMNALRTRAMAANYDPDAGRLTVTVFDRDKNGRYLNQAWNPALDPLQGDAMNAYNDGPLTDGSIMGPFLEVESASSGAFLKPGETLRHRHTVFHFVGNDENLSVITEILFGISVDHLKTIFR